MSAVFKTPFVVDLPFCGVWSASNRASSVPDPVNPVDGYSEVILCPGSTACYFHTLGGTNTLPAAAFAWTAADTLLPESHNFQMIPILATAPLGSDIVDGVTYMVHGLRSYNTPTGNSLAVLPKLDSRGVPCYECVILPLSTVAGSDLDILLGFFNAGILANTRTTAHLTLFWDSGAVVTLDLEVSSTGDNNTAHSGFYVFQTVLPVNDDQIRLFQVSVDDNDFASDWRFSLASGSVDGYGFGLPTFSACSFKVVDAPEMDDLSETSDERTSALTGLITYMGSSLQDGGQVAAARLGMGLSPLRAPEGDVYTYVASLPYYSDDFALREGIYSWWLPDSIQEHFYVPYRSPRSDDLAVNSALQFVVLRDNPNQAVRLKVVQNLEVISRSRLYSAKAGPNNPSYAVVIGAIKAIPAVTVNAKHTGILGKAFNWVKGWLSKPANFKKLVNTGASVIQRLGAR
jgi:hypothetical protein